MTLEELRAADVLARRKLKEAQAKLSAVTSEVEAERLAYQAARDQWENVQEKAAAVAHEMANAVMGQIEAENRYKDRKKQKA
jgi:uncharacterized protein (DUF3084 family)